MFFAPEFQLACQDDSSSLLNMMEEFYSIDQYPFKRGTASDNIRLFLSNESLGRIWMIRLDGETIGYVILTVCFSFEFQGKTAFIDELFIVAGARGKGIGGKVIEFVVQQAEHLQIKALHLEVERHNVTGNRLYLSRGFKEHNRFLMTRLIG
jgi:GNAT superfamily N-acetyltransferase